MSSEIDPCEAKSTANSRKWMRRLVILVAVGLSITVPAAASAHGPVVIDCRGAPYLRFDSRGVAANTNSAMYYLNQTPVAEPLPPASPATRARIGWR